MHTARARTHDAALSLTLDDLSERSSEELDALYRAAAVPHSLREVDGDPRGRMLAVRALGREPVAGALRRLAASESFVWGGKSFTSEGDRTGRGINRVRIPLVLGQQNLFPFATRFDRSVIDGKATVVLDYDRPENPPYIRKVHDEIRVVSPGVYLGPAMWKTERGPSLVLWFALAYGA